MRSPTSCNQKTALEENSSRHARATYSQAAYRAQEPKTEHTRKHVCECALAAGQEVLEACLSRKQKTHSTTLGGA